MTDVQFSVMTLPDEAANVVERVSYDAYGDARHRTYPPAGNRADNMSMRQVVTGLSIMLFLSIPSCRRLDPSLELLSRLQATSGEMWLVYSEIGQELSDDELVSGLIEAVEAKGVMTTCPTDEIAFRVNPDVSVWRGDSATPTITIVSGCKHAGHFIAICDNFDVIYLNDRELPSWYGSAPLMGR